MRAGRCTKWVFKQRPPGVGGLIDFTFRAGRRSLQSTRVHLLNRWDAASVFLNRFRPLESTATYFASVSPALDGATQQQGNTPPILHRPYFLIAGRALLVAILYYVGAKIGFLLKVPHHPVSTLWPTNAILAGMLLLAPRRQGWLILAAALPGHLAVELGSGVPVSMVLCWFVSNCTEALVASAGVRWFAGSPVRFDTFQRMVWFLVAGAFVAPFASSFLDAGFVTLIGWGADNYWEVWRMRLLSNVLAMLTIVPLIVMAGSQRLYMLMQVTRERVIEGLVLAIGLVAVGAFVFHGHKLPVNIVPTLVYVPLPFLLWAAVRFGTAGLSSLMLATALLTISGTLHELGPFSHMAPLENVFSLQVFLIVMFVPLMLLSAVLQERQTAGRALDESEARFRIAADAAPVMLWMSGLDKHCTFFNKGWLEFTGRSLSSELGDGWAEGVHPDDFQSCLATYTTSFDQRKPFRMEYRLRRRGGEYGWILDEGVPSYAADGSFGGYVGIAIDITERKQIEAALGQSEKRYREVVESQTDLICRCLPDTTLTFVNEAYCAFFGKQREELIGRSLLHLIPREQHAPILERIYSMVRHPETVTLERPTVGADGGERWHQWIVCPTFDDAGHVVEFQAIARDITERLKAEENLRATHERLNALARQLLHAQEEERRRIARELHDDFNQRLAAHAVALSNFRDALVSGEVSVLEKLAKLQDDAVSLSDEIRLIAHELHPSRIEHAGFESTLRSFCSEFSALTRLDIDLQVEIKKPLPVDITLGCFRIVQESLRNVVKHAQAMKVQVRVHLVDGRIVLLVADDGAGVEDQKLKSAHGLGITSMVERIELLAGEFHISKRKTGGTLIAVEVPIS
jgi:PAS domain S-box-containing protein